MGHAACKRLAAELPGCLAQCRLAGTRATTALATPSSLQRAAPAAQQVSQDGVALGRDFAGLAEAVGKLAAVELRRRRAKAAAARAAASGAGLLAAPHASCRCGNALRHLRYAVFLVGKSSQRVERHCGGGMRVGRGWRSLCRGRKTTADLWCSGGRRGGLRTSHWLATCCVLGRPLHRSTPWPACCRRARNTCVPPLRCHSTASPCLSPLVPPLACLSLHDFRAATFGARGSSATRAVACQGLTACSVRGDSFCTLH